MMRLGEAASAEDRAAEAAIRLIPEWSGAAVRYGRAAAPVMSPMHKAVDSDCYAVDVDDAPYFLKIIHPELRATVDLAASFDAAIKAAACGVAPVARHCLPAAHALVFDRLDADWRTAMVDDLRAASAMSEVLAAKKRIHAGASFQKTWSVFDAIAALLLLLSADERERVPDLWWLSDAVGDIGAAFAAAGTDSTPCHADGLASNIMLGPGGAVRLVDFDGACNTDPLYDVAILLNEAYAFEDEMMPALEIYEGRVRPATLARCRLYAIADDFYWGLWASRMDATSARRGIEFLKYANWRLLRCRMALGETGAERWLRTI